VSACTHEKERQTVKVKGEKLKEGRVEGEEKGSVLKLTAVIHIYTTYRKFQRGRCSWRNEREGRRGGEECERGREEGGRGRGTVGGREGGWKGGKKGLSEVGQKGGRVGGRDTKREHVREGERASWRGVG